MVDHGGGNVLERAVAKRPADRISTDVELWRAAPQPLKDVTDAGKVLTFSQGILGGQSLAVVAGSRYVDRALAFIWFVTSEGAQKILASHGIAPTAIGAYNDPNLRASIPHLVRVREAVEMTSALA
ncbi:hypothetical protein [Micromonospora sp. LOL_015]|uniref:hypothetical protein n=1 Tax=Micromonospora sp. LOL_015 TaxID=3345416 RepID=UPI003A897061